MYFFCFLPYLFLYFLPLFDSFLYLFNLFGARNDDDLRVSAMMVKYWTNFASSGDPNVRHTNATALTPLALPAWPAYSPEKDVAMRLDTPLETEVGYRAGACAFWAAVQPGMYCL